MLCSIVFLLVDAQDYRDVFVLCRRGDDHLLYATPEVLLCVFRFGKQPGRFDHNLSAYRFPVDRCGISLREHAKLIAINPDAVFCRRNSMIEITEHGVIFKQVRECSSVSQIVNCHEIDVRIAN